MKNDHGKNHRKVGGTNGVGINSISALISAVNTMQTTVETALNTYGQTQEFKNLTPANQQIVGSFFTTVSFPTTWGSDNFDSNKAKLVSELKNYASAFNQSK